MTKQVFKLLLLAFPLSLSLAGLSIAEEVKDEKSRSCIPTRTLKNTAVVDDLNILFFKVGGTIYHNILPRPCTGLSRFRAFSYSTLSGSLCNFDTIQVLNRSGRDGQSCRLGHFHPIAMDEIPALVAGSSRQPEPVPQPPAKVEDIVVEPGESEKPEEPTPE